MSDENAGEYDLAEIPEASKKRPTPPPEKPLPRLWKTEPEEDEDTVRPRKGKPEADTDGDAKPAPQSGETRRRSRPEKTKDSRKSAPAAGGEKRVLVEDTPAMETYEGRQRARLLVGGLVASCFMIFGYVFYQLFIYDPLAVEQTGDEPIPTVTAVAAFPPAAKRDLDVEARSMLKRAEEDAKGRRTKEAMVLLETIVKSYKGTRSAAEGKAALDRFNQGFPLFPDGPAVKAQQPTRPQPPPAPAPPAIVQAQARQTTGSATLTLPSNAPELTPSQPSIVVAQGPGPGMASPTPTPTPTPAPTPASAPLRPLSDGFEPSREAGVHSSGWPLRILGKRDGAPMVLVPGGTFVVGNDDGPPSEAPSHKVRLSAYYIDQHEVTVNQFQLFLSETHYRGQPPHSANWSEDFRKNPNETLPMVMVNARDAQAYADWAQKQLPTEAQWEAAARSTDGRLYPWGSDPKAISRPTGDWTLQPVKSTPGDVSPYGVFDMGGNVLEWTRDWYDSRYYHRLPVDGADNPSGPATKPRSLEYVVKGERKKGTPSSRQGMMREKRLNYVGFRCVLPVQDQPVLRPGLGAPGSVLPVPPPGQPPVPRPGPGNSQPPPVPF